LAKLLRLLAFLILPATALADDYVIGRGDTLEVSVFNVPALRHRGAVGPDGKIVFPPVGAINADGLTPGQLSADVQKMLSAKNVTREPDVTVEVVEYRPVYVSGDVAKPGAYGYRANITVQQAVAEAGGYGPLIDSHGIGAILEAANLKSDVGTIAIELTKQQLKAARLTAELNSMPAVTLGKTLDDIDPALVTSLTKTQTDLFVAETDDREKRVAYFQRMIQSTKNLIDFLSDAAEQLAQARAQQASDAARATELQRRGVGTISRTEDEQRAIILLQSQILDVKARSQQAHNDLENYIRDLQTYDDEHRMRWLEELSNAASEVARLTLQLAGARGKLHAASGIGFRKDLVPKAAIYRRVNGSRERLEADESTVLLPGDVVEITMPSERLG
jgi:polysaccharide export outer membrane protein